MYSIQDLKTARMVLNYLYKNPEAKDTFQGITEWWLLNERVESAIDEIKHALDYLLEHDLLEVRCVNGNQRFYQINRRKFKAVQKTLEILDHRTKKA